MDDERLTDGNTEGFWDSYEPQELPPFLPPDVKQKMIADEEGFTIVNVRSGMTEHGPRWYVDIDLDSPKSWEDEDGAVFENQARVTTSFRQAKGPRDDTLNKMQEFLWDGQNRTIRAKFVHGPKKAGNPVVLIVPE